MPDFDEERVNQPEEPQDEAQAAPWGDVTLQPDGEPVGDFMERLAAIREGENEVIPAEPDWQGPDILHNLRLAIGAAVDGHPERLEFAVSISAIPGAQGQPVAVGLVVLAIPSAEIGQKINTTLILQNLWPSPEEVQHLVRQATEQMLDFRSAQAAQALQPQ